MVFKQEAAEDARMFAQQAPELIAEDFMTLGLYEIYVRPVAGGITSSWALARSLPPTPGPFDPAEVAAASYARHQPLPPVTPDPVVTADSETDLGDEVTDETPVAPDASADSAPASPIGPVGRVKRQQGANP